eukprot:10408775-Karenia_brevis.AAC.1
MRTGPLPQDILIVRAIVPSHQDLATIQMFKMWTNLGKKHDFSNTTQQFTDAEVADLIKDMVKGSEKSAWMMLKDVPKKTVYLANPLDSTAQFEGGRLMDNNPPLNLGSEHIDTQRT